MWVGRKSLHISAFLCTFAVSDDKWRVFPFVSENAAAIVLIGIQPAPLFSGAARSTLAVGSRCQKR